MAISYLIDTDVFIDQLRGAARLPAGARTASYSVVTRCELLVGKHTDHTIVETLLGPLQEFPVDRPIANQAGMLRRTVGISIADALIAATALRHDLPVMTRNQRHFARVPGLRLEPPQ